VSESSKNIKKTGNFNLKYKKVNRISYSLSLLIHALILIVFFFVSFTVYTPSKKIVELSFGTSGKTGSSGAIGTQIKKIEEVSKPKPKSETKAKNRKVKKVNLPKARNTEVENVVKAASNNKKKNNTTRNKIKEKTNSNQTAEGRGNKAKGNGSLGYDINWGGKGQRKIYSYILPTYPKGVNKQIDIRLKFSILPDGTIGTIIPLIKANTRLENAAINSLRQWRFEALAPNQKQVEQTAVIVFPYRLQ